MQRLNVSYILTWVFVIALVLVSLPAPGVPTASAAGMPRRAVARDAAGTMPVVINEVMPKRAKGGSAWVELLVGQSVERVYLPAVRRTGSADQQANLTPSRDASAAAGVNLAGWQVSNETGRVYTLPDRLSSVPNGVFVLIYFDGKGPAGDDYDASDGTIILHTPAGLGDVFPDRAGQVALYRSGRRTAQTIVDFVAWGGFDAEAGANAVAAGVWPSGHAVSFENGFGDISEADILEPNESIGRYPNARGRGASAWANYPKEQLSPGRANPVQPVLFITPEDGAKVDAATLSLSWRPAAGATRYRFQLDDDAGFTSPLIDEMTSHTYFKPDPVPDAGVYYWRINPIRGDSASGWTRGFQIEVVTFSGVAAAAAGEKVLGIARVRQNKDSYLLGLDGAPEGDPTTNTPENAWDSPAPCTEPPCADTTKYTHGSMYCVRASVRMMASWYNGGNMLSMDRISYHVLEEWSGNTRPGANDGIPDNDLGYARGMYYPDEEDQAISWALNTTINTPGGKPTFAQIRGWIDANRPIMFRRPGHMMVINGYRETADGDQYIHVLDPDQPPDFERWQDYDSQTIEGYWVGPASGTGRVDESSVWTDSDGDGIMDFDEVIRFQLDPHDVDTDGDWVLDKRDMREYVFDAAGNYSKRASDLDGDGLRKERDPDNDNDGSPDGCEDTDFDGIYDSGSGETNNFSNASSQACVPRFNILYPLKTSPTNAGDPSAPDKILVQVSTAVPAGWSLSLTAGDFDVSIGGDAASVISVYPSADTYFLVVAPPTKGTAAYYDLRVRLSGVGTDSENNAVYYLAKARNDEVIVLDRSGSMSSDGKMEAAQNAASAFVDFLNDGDAVGVVSFASSASTDYALTTIAGVAERAAAIAAINGLTSGGTTALGQGVQQGHGLLTGDGDPNHDWSLVLLSDGWENVPPYWADVEAGITDAVVHTVALGDGADKALLQSIAGAKHGQYFYVDVNPPGASGASASSPSGGPPLAIPDTLPNRLADTYIAVGELTHGLQRLAERTGSAREQQTIEFKVWVNKGMPEAIFTLNWDHPGGYLELLLEDPDGKPASPSAQYRDDTHHQVRVRDPKPGLWTVRIRILKPTPEYHFMLSGKTMTTLIAAVGGDPERRAVGVPVPIYGILTDHKPIGESLADVYALVSGPGLASEQPQAAGSTGVTFLRLYDDGRHGDGKAGDGFYANVLTGITQPGGYTVKLVAVGTNNREESFLRYASVGFNVRPRAAYLWNDDLDTALDYQGLLQENGWVVDLVELRDVPRFDFSPYSLIVVGPETGYHYDFDDPDAVGALAQWDASILGLGEGGAALFAELDLFIGYGQTWFSSNNNVYAVAPGTVFWNEPWNIDASPKNPLVQLYPRRLRELGVYIPEPFKLVTPIAREERNETHYPVVLEVRSGRKYVLWGYNAGPDAMTKDGRKLLVNLSHYLRQ